MKNLIKTFISLLFLFGIHQNILGQNKATHLKQKAITFVSIHTSACCEHCKDRLEFELIYTKGIVDADFDEKSEQIKIKYKSKKITEEKVRSLISSLGYDADDLKADILSFSKLETYCKSIAIE